MTTLKHGDIHHQSPPPLQHLGSLTHIKSEQGNFFTYAVSTDNSQDLILYASSQTDGTMDFLLDGENGGSSRESVANLLDEGLGTSLDGTDEISSIHSTLGRNDSGVFSSDETTSLAGSQTQITATARTTTTTTATTTTGSETPGSGSGSDGGGVVAGVANKKHRPKNSSPNRQGPQRCAICGKQFSNASALTKHKLTHSDERKHACSLCGKAFKRQDHLNGHMLTHRNKKPFECTAKGCGKSYCDARSLRRHVESRHGQETLAAMNESIAQAQLDALNAPNKSPNQGPFSPENNVQVKLIVTTESQSSGGQENILMDTSDVVKMLGLDASQFVDSQVCLSPRKNPAEENLVLVKIEAPVQSPEIDMDLSLNMDTTPATMAMIQEAIPEQPQPTKDYHKKAMRTSQSQLHQLLTQRANKTNPYNNIPGGANGFDMNWVVKTEIPDNINEMRTSKMSSSGSHGHGNDVTTSSSTSTTTATANATATTNAARGSTKSSISGNGTSPTGLKEQLEFIAQIIQRAQQETSNCAAAAAAANASTGNGKPTKGGSKKSKAAAAAAANNGNLGMGGNGGVKIEGENGNGRYGSGGKPSCAPGTGGEDKPVECTMCLRRFKNTPALNGHMRLHGGYFKKDTDGKRRDASCKESSNAPLQTISQSVKDLIGEKINQKRNTGVSTTSTTTTTTTQGMDRSVNQVSSSSASSSSATSSPPSQNEFVETLVSLASASDEGYSNGLNLPTSNNPLSMTFTSVSPLESHHHSETPPQTFQFVYGDDPDNAEYLLMADEVFNKVSSICPDSFLNGIDESILSVTAVGNDELGPEWSWTSGSTPGPDSDVNSRLNSFFAASTPEEQHTTTHHHQHQFNKLEGGGGPFTPLPPLDPVFYMSPAPQSPSLHSQDSPSFIYPTPPASLESHNALQSPLFPFPVTTTTTQTQIPSNANGNGTTTTLIFPFETQTNFNVIANTLITCANNNDGGNGGSSDYLGSGGNANNIQEPMDTLFSTNSNSNNNSPIPTSTGGYSSELLLGNSGGSTSHPVRHFEILRGGSGGGVGVSDLNFLTPSNSPSLQIGSAGSSCSTEDSLHSMKELKINEPSRMDCSTAEEDIFLNPNSVPNSPCIKSPKRKQIRNTFASNLRPHPSVGTTPHNTHFTPYPILSPVRHAPGLYWKFSVEKLTHVDDSKKETPRINVGTNFQAELPSPCMKMTDFDVVNSEQPEPEDLMWDPKVMEICSEEQVDNFLALACSTAVPGGGRNKEYALHLLRLCNGDIREASLLLMNPAPVLPEYLMRCDYPENAKWSYDEIKAFEGALHNHGKDFVEVVKEIKTRIVKSNLRVKDCIAFYHVWKRVCPKNYHEFRNIWKKTDAAFTLGLLKTVPPPLVSSGSRHSQSQSHIHAATMSNILEFTEVKNKVPIKILDTPSPACDSLNVQNSQVHSREEFPCKVCGKIFNKVKSRSAHMKSHRPPEQCDNNNVPNKKSKYQQQQPQGGISTMISTATVTSSAPAPNSTSAIITLTTSTTDSSSLSLSSTTDSTLVSQSKPNSQTTATVTTNSSAISPANKNSSSGNNRDT